MSVSELRTTAAPEKIPTAAELVGRARTLAPKLRERALKAERDRNVPREIGRGIYRGWPDPYPAAEALGRLRARPRSRVRHCHRARQVDLRLIGLGLELFRRSRLHSGPFPGRGAARRLERKQRRVHRHVGGADRQSVDRARRLSPRRPLVVVQRLGALAVDHDRRLDLPRRRGSPRHAAVPRSGVPGEAGRHLVLRRPARVRLDDVCARQRVRPRASYGFLLDAARRLLSRLEDQHQSDLSHAVHRRAQLCVARPGARRGARRLWRFRAMDARSAT